VNFLYNYFGKIVFYTYTNQGHNYKTPHGSLQVNLNFFLIIREKTNNNIKENGVFIRFILMYLIN